MEHIPAVTYVEEETASSYRMLYCSPQAERLFGYPADAFVADPALWYRLIHPDDQLRVEAADEYSLRTGEIFDLEYRVISKDGRVHWLHDRAMPRSVELPGTSTWVGVTVEVVGKDGE